MGVAMEGGQSPVDFSCLESSRPRKGPGGSNPSPSARNPAARLAPVKADAFAEGERIAFGASGRNGGFMDASLTHGIENGVARWPDEMPRLEQLGRDNFAAI